MFNKVQKSKVRAILKSHFGHSNLGKIRTYLKSKSVYEYGCNYYKEYVGNGISVSYTSNPNCYASYLIDINGVGMISSNALTSKDVTKAGKLRGCKSHYLF